MSDSDSVGGIRIPVTDHFVLCAGPNGGGKTTAMMRFWNQALTYIDPDAIQKKLGTPVSQVAFSHASRRVMDKLKSPDRASFGLETTLAGKRPEGLLEWAQNYDYKVVLCYFVPSNVNVCIDNVRARVNNKNGHDVPEDTIRTRYNSSLRNFSKLCSLVDEWHLFFNDGKSYRLVARSINGDAKCITPDVVPLLPLELQNALPQLLRISR